MPRRRKPGPSANRTDTLASVQPIRVAENQPYGEAKAQADAQRTVPLPQDTQMRAVEAATAVDPTPVGAPGPSRFPDQPVTHGLAVGPGGGPNAMPHLAVPGPAPDPTIEELRAIYSKYPSEDLRAILEEAESR